MFLHFTLLQPSLLALLAAAADALRMAFYPEIVLWSASFLLAGAAVPSVNHAFIKTCAVKGSTVTLPCSFTPLKSFFKEGKEVPLKIVRVGWCRNHGICQGLLPDPVYDSKSENNDPRYQYLGDMEGNCTLRIRDIKMEDKATFHFRMEADDPKGHFTNQTGVNITVEDGIKMSIKNSKDGGRLRDGSTISLQCTSLICTTHQLKITWFRDGHALSETGSTLQLGPLTAGDSGNYSCGLGSNVNTLSEPYSLQVEPAEEAQSGSLFLILGVVVGVLLVVITLVLVVFIIKRKQIAADDLRSADREMGQKEADNVYSDIVTPAMEDEGRRERETSREMEDISYAPIRFKKATQRREVEEAGDATIYSSVATRG